MDEDREDKIAVITRLCVCLFILQSLCLSAFASTTDWRWQFCTVDPGKGGSFGTSATTSDGADFLDISLPTGRYLNCATYYEQGVGGWTAETGFYSTDIRSPLVAQTENTKTWLFYFWGSPSLTSSNMYLTWGYFSDNTPDFQNSVYTLKYVRPAVGITEGYVDVGTTISLNYHSQGTWKFPAYATTNGLDGYMFELTATVIPEPASILALLTGLAGIGGIAIKRRQA
ncbi:MAG: PEP-CTERM sorting domain-containing protein [Armatimonadota bacterium]|nr:PEP-CTERM sorting domain-containing protein [bacterium]